MDLLSPMDWGGAAVATRQAPKAPGASRAGGPCVQSRCEADGATAGAGAPSLSGSSDQHFAPSGRCSLVVRASAAGSVVAAQRHGATA